MESFQAEVGIFSKRQEAKRKQKAIKSYGRTPYPFIFSILLHAS